MDRYVNTSLGKKSEIPKHPSKDTLVAIERSGSALRSSPNFSNFAMIGEDIWNCYEFSWLGGAGIPQAAMCRIAYPSSSKSLVESKSLKLYLASFYNTPFSEGDLERQISSDLAETVGAGVVVEFFNLKAMEALGFADKEDLTFKLDNMSVVIPSRPSVENLKLNSEEPAEDRLSSDVFRSVCPVTGQPDWASVEIHYSGNQLNRESVFSYLLGFREHAGFHEEVCEQIYFDILQKSKASFLMVTCNFLRRGGIDINPIRYTPGYQGGLQYHRKVRQ